MLTFSYIANLLTRQRSVLKMSTQICVDILIQCIEDLAT